MHRLVHDSEKKLFRPETFPLTVRFTNSHNLQIRCIRVPIRRLACSNVTQCRREATARTCGHGNSWEGLSSLEAEG
ncbi:protein of unknown function [Nitrospira defluvii]|uniref:Uncharacterized protein n=1 Tax=Nitrospira defluvii TaxID=330214 RepID=D8PIV1_9BACT|nr:protein of unknown function [Nitrospira defluvii]